MTAQRKERSHQVLMKTNDKRQIQSWDLQTILKSVVIGIVLESILIAPGIPSKLFPWGHAGPETLPGLLGFLLNLPGFAIFTTLTSDREFSIEKEFLFVFLIQTLIISFCVFVILRLRKRANEKGR